MSRKRIPWLPWFLRFSLPALLISAKATAQGKLIVRQNVVCNVGDNSQSLHPPILRDKKIVEGKVCDSKGYPIIQATVMVKGTQNGVVTDTSGAFRIWLNQGSELIVSSVGYVSQTVTVKDASLNIVLMDAFVAFDGEVVVITKPKKKKNQIPLIKKITDTAFRNFSVYPNPVHRNSIIKIDGSKLESGEYVVSVIDMTGEVILNQEVSLVEKRKTVDVQLENTSAGTYIVHLFNRKSAASWSEKIIVQ